MADTDDIRDSILMEVAGWIEEGDFISLAGILHKRKRMREDAELRIKTSDEVRQRMVDMIRGRMKNKVGDDAEFLRDVADGRFKKLYTGFDLRHAFSLADKGLLTVHVRTQVGGDWSNTLGGITDYEIALTDKGISYITTQGTPA